MMNNIKDIVDNDLCTGCGICVTESKSSEMIWNENGFLVPRLDGSFNENAIKLCPFNPNPDDDVKDEDKLANLFLDDATKSDYRIGKFENTYVGYSKEFRETSSSGGIATFVFEYLLNNKIVDHLFIVKEVNGSYAYRWFNEVDQITAISKTRYIPVTLENLFKEIDEKSGKIAVSGVACFIKAIRLKQFYNPEYREKIAFLVGIICGGLKSSFFTDYLAQKSGIETSYKKQDYRIKDAKSSASDYSFGAFDANDRFHQIKMRKVGDMWGTGLFKANACDFCNDVTTELADISLGDAWLDEYRPDGLGNSIVITRSKQADSIVQEGINYKQLHLKPLSPEKVYQSQKGGFTHRQDTLKIRVDMLRRKGKIVPNQRERFFQKSDFTLLIVQYTRRITRKQSISIWRKYKSSVRFEKAIKNYLRLLIIATRINHKFRKS